MVLHINIELGDNILAHNLEHSNPPPQLKQNKIKQNKNKNAMLVVDILFSWTNELSFSP